MWKKLDYCCCNLTVNLSPGRLLGTVRKEDMETSRFLPDGTNWLLSSMISLIHQACMWIEILCIILSSLSILSLTTDVSIECLQLSQQR